jgi:hypothetical protein
MVDASKADARVDEGAHSLSLDVVVEPLPEFVGWTCRQLEALGR